MSSAFNLALTCNITSAGNTAFFFALRTFQSNDLTLSDNTAQSTPLGLFTNRRAKTQLAVRVNRGDARKQAVEAVGHVL
jgi:hypothetical protein